MRAGAPWPRPPQVTRPPGRRLRPCRTATRNAARMTRCGAPGPGRTCYGRPEPLTSRYLVLILLPACALTRPESSAGARARTYGGDVRTYREIFTSITISYNCLHTVTQVTMRGHARRPAARPERASLPCPSTGTAMSPEEPLRSGVSAAKALWFSERRQLPGCAEPVDRHPGEPRVDGERLTRMRERVK
jgi:hypothetical protein